MSCRPQFILLCANNALKQSIIPIIQALQSESSALHDLYTGCQPSHDIFLISLQSKSHKKSYLLDVFVLSATQRVECEVFLAGQHVVGLMCVVHPHVHTAIAQLRTSLLPLITQALLSTKFIHQADLPSSMAEITAASSHQHQSSPKAARAPPASSASSWGTTAASVAQYLWRTAAFWRSSPTASPADSQAQQSAGQLPSAAGSPSRMPSASDAPSSSDGATTEDAAWLHNRAETMAQLPLLVLCCAEAPAASAGDSAMPAAVATHMPSSPIVDDVDDDEDDVEASPGVLRAAAAQDYAAAATPATTLATHPPPSALVGSTSTALLADASAEEIAAWRALPSAQASVKEIRQFILGVLR